MSCGFWLRVNGVWTPLEGVQSGVGYQWDRPSSEVVSVGGVRHVTYAPRAPRTWPLDLGAQADPSSVAALMVAASGDGGDVWLWDEAAARANMLDPVMAAGRSGCPVVDCGGLALRSLTAGPSSLPDSVVVPAAANMTVAADGFAFPGFGLTAGFAEGLIRFMVPQTPDGRALVSAELVLTGPAADGIDAHLTHSGWVETSPFDIESTYWASVPAGALLGSAAWVDGGWTLPLGDVSAHEGSALSMRLSVDTGDAAPVNRFQPVGFPVLRLTYGLIAEDRTVSQHIKADTDVWVTFWSDAPANTVLGTVMWGDTPTTLRAGSGSGMRHHVRPFTATGDDLDWSATITDSDDYLLAGLGMTTLDPTGSTPVYVPGHKAVCRVRVDDPTLTLDSLYPGEQGNGQRAVTIREVG